jgi:histidine phosphotransferase ChpT
MFYTSPYDKPKPAPLTSPIILDGLDLAALIASRVCHDVISPVGAIVNGLEVLDSDKDPEMQEFALDLIRKSAKNASSRLQFCRIAFGAAGSAGSSIDTRDANNVASNFINDEKNQLEWLLPPAYLPKNRVKLLLNLLVLSLTSIPRGGKVRAALLGAGELSGFLVEATGRIPRIPPHCETLISGYPHNETNSIDAHAVQPFYTGMLARECGMTITITKTDESVLFRAE